MEILRETISTSASIANAMGAVVALWGGQPDDVVRRFGTATYADEIETMYPRFAEEVSESRSYICEHWNEVLENGLMQREVKEYLGALTRFFTELRSFEQEFCRNDNEAFGMFGDAWIARKYFVLMLEQKAVYEGLFKALDEIGRERPEVARPFRGMAYAFRDYFVGVTDTALEDLILNHKQLTRRPVWLGDRVEATIFARVFGLTASMMNRSFLIKDKYGAARKLNLAGDCPSRRFEEYGIWAPIEKYKHCRQ